MFRILWDPFSGSIKRASLKLLVMFFVRSRCLAAWNLDLWCVCVCCDECAGLQSSTHLHTERTYTHQMLCCRINTFTFTFL